MKNINLSFQVLIIFIIVFIITYILLAVNIVTLLDEVFEKNVFDQLLLYDII